jgi:hypothetical protein
VDTDERTRPLAERREHTLHGPPLTQSEIAALLARGVERLEELGVPHERAVEAVAAEHNVPGERVARLLGNYGYASRDQALVLA